MTLQRLDALEAGAGGRIARVEAGAAIRHRLLEMGLVPGETLTVKKLAPLGDPMELVVKGYHLSLRRAESACILVERD